MKNEARAADAGPRSRRERGRPRSFDVNQALAKAMLLFWKKGYEGTSIADLTGALGIEAPSLYAAFGSKSKLFQKALLHYGATYENAVWARFSAATTARKATEAYLTDSAGALSGSIQGVPTGCMAVLSRVDNDAQPELGRFLREARALTFERLRSRYERAVAEGEIPEGVDARSLARFVQDVQSGMSTLARDGVDREELEQVARVAMHGWDGCVTVKSDRSMPPDSVSGQLS